VQREKRYLLNLNLLPRRISKYNIETTLGEDLREF